MASGKPKRLIDFLAAATQNTGPFLLISGAQEHAEC